MNTDYLAKPIIIGRKFGWLSMLGVSMFFQGCIHIPQTTAFDADLPRTVVDGYPLYTEQYGDRPDVVIVVHGGPGGDSKYLQSLSALSDEYRVVLYDQRGTGLSARESVPASFRDFVDRQIADLDGLVDHFGQGRPVRLIGHSWGGMLVSAYLGRHPEKVSHAVIAEPGILRPEVAPIFVEKLKESQSISAMLGIVPAFVKMIFVASVDGHERTDYVLTAMSGRSEGPPYLCPGDRMPADFSRRSSYAVMKATTMPMMDDPSVFNVDLTDGLNRYNRPLLLLSSEYSFIGYDYQEQYHRSYLPAQTEHVKLAQNGHTMFTVRPEAAIALVRGFFRR